MVFRYTNQTPTQAVDINQRLGQLAGFGVVEGGEPSIGARPYAVDFLSATATVDGETVELPPTTIDLEDWVDPDDPRKAVVYIGLTHGNEGEYRVAAGRPRTPAPEGEIRFDTYEPSPPDIGHLDAAPVVEVWLDGDAQQVIEDDIRDRRLSSSLTAHTVSAVQTQFDSLIDGAGVRHDDELGPSGTSWDDVDIIEAINTDNDHGVTAPHTYFSADHTDLSNIQSGQHHTRRSDSDFQDAMTGLDVADLSGDRAAAPGMHLSIPDGVNTQWTEPPLAEAPVVASGTVTHTGGSSTNVTIENVTPSAESLLDLSVGVSVGETPSWSADYGYSHETAFQWDSSGDHVDLDLTLQWDIDPGAGNDLVIQYRVIDMSEDGAMGLYDDQSVRDAVSGATLRPNTLDVSNRLATPEASEPPSSGGEEIGDTVIVDGSGTADFGIYVYDGASWTGPYATGLTSIGELTIDTMRDWGGNRITGLGTASGSNSALNLGALESHADDPAAHHAPVTGSDINHANLQNVQPDQHHSEPSESEIAEAIAGQLFEVGLTTAAIPDGGSSRIHVRVASDEEFRLLRGEFYNELGNTPSGLRIQVRDRDSGTTEYGQYLWHQTGTINDPLVALSGPMDLEIRMNNVAGSTQVAGGVVAYALQ